MLGHIPTGWWPSAVSVSADGNTLFVANARGRGAAPNLVGEVALAQAHRARHGEHHSHVRRRTGLDAYTERVLANNGFVEDRACARQTPRNPIPSRLGEAQPIRSST